MTHVPLEELVKMTMERASELKLTPNVKVARLVLIEVGMSYKDDYFPRTIARKCGEKAQETSEEEAWARAEPFGIPQVKQTDFEV